MITKKFYLYIAYAFSYVINIFMLVSAIMWASLGLLALAWYLHGAPAAINIVYEYNKEKDVPARIENWTETASGSSVYPEYKKYKNMQKL